MLCDLLLLLYALGLLYLLDLLLLDLLLLSALILLLHLLSVLLFVLILLLFLLYLLLLLSALILLLHLLSVLLFALVLLLFLLYLLLLLFTFILLLLLCVLLWLFVLILLLCVLLFIFVLLCLLLLWVDSRVVPRSKNRTAVLKIFIGFMMLPPFGILCASCSGSAAPELSGFRCSAQSHYVKLSSFLLSTPIQSGWGSVSPGLKPHRGLDGVQSQKKYRQCCSSHAFDLHLRFETDLYCESSV